MSASSYLNLNHNYPFSKHVPMYNNMIKAIKAIAVLSAVMLAAAAVNATNPAKEAKTLAILRMQLGLHIY
ncbi:MAG: hypothetical protein JO297_04555 [Nitrososphaeraceae archaeon]|nr:hypothetical protein [Nitrososphaeraceae archaeon]